MNKSELITALSEKSQSSLALARDVVETMIDLVKKQLMDGGRVEIRGFGVFEIHEYKAYRSEIQRLEKFCRKAQKDAVL